jgi:hypothetical protein
MFFELKSVYSKKYWALLFVFLLTLLTAGYSWAVDIHYSSVPGLRQLTSGGATIELMMDSTTGSGNKITDGVARFKVKKISGNFPASGVMEIYEIGLSLPIATINYSAGTAETSFVNFYLAGSFSSGTSSGTKGYYAQHRGNANVKSGAIRVTAEPQYPVQYLLYQASP